MTRPVAAQHQTERAETMRNALIETDDTGTEWLVYDRAGGGTRRERINPVQPPQPRPSRPAQGFDDFAIGQS